MTHELGQRFAQFSVLKSLSWFEILYVQCAYWQAYHVTRFFIINNIIHKICASNCDMDLCTAWTDSIWQIGDNWTFLFNRINSVPFDSVRPITNWLFDDETKMRRWKEKWHTAPHFGRKIPKIKVYVIFLHLLFFIDTGWWVHRVSVCVCVIAMQKWCVGYFLKCNFDFSFMTNFSHSETRIH